MRSTLRIPRSWLMIPLLSALLTVSAKADPDVSSANPNVPVSKDAGAAPASGIEVLKMVLCKDLKDHEPGDAVKDFKVGDVAIGWSQIRSGLGEVEVTHRWRHNGDIISDVKLPIKSSPYRTWSRKTLADAGSWTWQILDTQGDVLKEVSFTVSQ